MNTTATELTAVLKLQRKIIINFEFDGKHFVQILGTTIGTRMAPPYANIFMDKLVRQLVTQPQQFCNS